MLACITNNGGYFEKDIVDCEGDGNDDKLTFFLPLKFISLHLRGQQMLFFSNLCISAMRRLLLGNSAGWYVDSTIDSINGFALLEIHW